MKKKTKQQSEKQRRQPPDAVAAPTAGAGVGVGAGVGSQKPAVPDKEALNPSGISPSIISSDSSSSIPVVGMGGSAGSLEAFKTFFAAMPVDSGAAFVIIQHLSPNFNSLLAEILATQTAMKVVQAHDALPVGPNCVYVIPPYEYLAVREGILYLAEPVMHDGIRMPIDYFFRSLAEDRLERAICIVFSGAGSDGTLGVRAVRGAGGLAIAQDPTTAQFDDMPRNAVATGFVDFVLSPDRMPEAILNYIRHPYVRGGQPQALPVPDAKVENTGLQDILSLVKAQKGCDFRFYKKATVVRRIERRMGLRQISEVARYYDLLLQDNDEISQLFKDLLINVTSFFRDAEAFEELRQKAIVPLVRDKQIDEPLRIWVSGCASGEEAYSLAMLLIEEVTAARKSCLVQVFATDVDEEALEFARQGSYPESIAQDIQPERLARFFLRTKRGYQVSDQVRKSVVFAVQNLVTDPPFSKMDLVSCRNLLIYLDSETQSKLMPLFNFALNPGGYLFLGKSEGTVGRDDLFDSVSKQARLFRRLSPARPVVLETPIVPGRKRAPAAPGGYKQQPTPLADMTRLAILKHFAAAVVLINRKGQILQFHGQTGKYLNMPMGEPSLGLLEMAREGFSTKLRSALYRVIETNKTVVLDSVPITREEGGPFVRISIAPASKQDEAEPLFSVIFEDIPRPQGIGITGVAAELTQSYESETVVKQLEDELRGTQQELQAAIEELQASNEELRVANEEVVSSNEELQSTVEELETSKEELQSVNEELTIVNSELQNKVENLDAINNDMTNFLKSTEVATLFLDSDLRIKLFTPSATRVLKLIPADMGRPVGDLSIGFTDFDLLSDARAVASGEAAIEREAQHADGSYYLVRILPYRMQKGEFAGVVVTFNDITSVKRAEKQTRRLATVVMDSNDAILLFDPEGNILTCNRGAETMYGWSETEALQMNIRDLTPIDRLTENTALIKRLLAREVVFSFETRRKTKDGRELNVWLTATAISDDTGKIEAIATTERDITNRLKAEEEVETFSVNQELKRKISELLQVNKELEAFIYSISHDLKAPIRSVSEFSRMVMEDYAEKLDEQGKDYLDRVRKGAEKMNRLVEALLSLSRISRQKVKRSEFDMTKAALAIVSVLREAEAGRSVAIDIAEGLIASADPSLLEIVLSNLLSNAWKFTSKTEDARIEFGKIKNLAGESNVYFIKDNGAGFDPEYMEKMFMPFHRLHSEEEFEGTGIGLAIAERIIHRHGGRIWAEGKTGQGATIFFTLPDISRQP